MSFAIEYLLKLSVSLTIVGLFYQLVLSRFTFYNWNRWYLLYASKLCFIIPLLNISPSLPETGGLSVARRLPTVQEVYQQVQQPLAVTTNEAAETPSGFEHWLWIVLAAGTIFMLCKLVFQLYAYLRIRNSASLVSRDEVSIYHVDQDIVPFSFGKSIFYNPGLHSESELKDIILHEYIHVRQQHTRDVLWGEMLCAISWFNPFAWLIRWSIRQNLEYIADEAVLNNDVDRRAYQYLLLKVAGYSGFEIGNPFNMSSLKRRVQMMNKTRTPRILLVSFLLLVPIAVTLLTVFRRDSDDSFEREYFYMMARTGKEEIVNRDIDEMVISGMILDARTAKPVTGLALEITYKQKVVRKIKTDANGFYYEILPIIEERKPLPGQDKAYGLFRESYQLNSTDSRYKGFAFGESGQADSQGLGDFRIIFTPKLDEYNASTNFFSVKKTDAYREDGSTISREEVLDKLQAASGHFVEEQQLITSFRDQNPRPGKVLTKFENAFFDRKKQLLGYDGELEFYLDGKKATYTEVNEAFASSPFMLKESQEYRHLHGMDNQGKIFYLTFDLHRDAPPVALLNGNIEVVNTQEFDPDILDKQPYMLDGFRQVYGVGSNLRPAKTDIVKIMKFKGRLARYYDSRLDEIWWIETRPATEVFERPDFASNL